MDHCGVVTTIERAPDGTRNITIQIEYDMAVGSDQYVIVDSGITDGNGKSVKGVFNVVSPEGKGRAITIAVKPDQSDLCANYLRKELRYGDSLKFSGPLGTGKFDVDSADSKSDDQEDPKKAKLRKGFTTGACTAAAARAATRAVLKQSNVDAVEITLPNKQKNTFNVNTCDIIDATSATCSVIKDAGDDPDCTHGAALTATVVLNCENSEIGIVGGEGVAMVTKPGLGLEVGKHAINPVPRKNITDMIREEIAGTDFTGALVTVSVPGGEEIAKQTSGERLGLIGGISILGTSGTVKPYSTTSYRASIVQQIKVAACEGLDTIILTTGVRSEKAAMELYPNHCDTAFVQCADFIGASLKAARASGIKNVVIVSMMGKLSKMADGQVQTHVAGSSVNIELLTRLADELGAPKSVQHEILSANTARHVLEICAANDLDGITQLICREASLQMMAYVDNEVEVKAHLIDFGGAQLGVFPK